MKRYKEKPEDQDVITEICDKVSDIHKANPQKYNANRMTSACLSLFVQSYQENGFSYETFCGELDYIKDFFKNKWETQ